MLIRQRTITITILLAIAALFSFALPAWAAPGQLAIEPAGTIELSRDDSGYSGHVTVRNAGSEPVHIERVVARTSAADPRMPPGVTADVDGASGPVDLAPGKSVKVTVSWRPDANVKAREVYGQILIESDALAAGATGPARPIGVGVHAELGTGLGLVGRHILSFLVFLPLTLIAASLWVRLRGKPGDDRHLRLFAVITMGLNLALALFLYARFDTSFSRLDGNDGYQFIEHAVWVRSLGVEYFLGVDGVSISMVLLTAIIAFVGALSSYSIKTQLSGYYAMYGLLVTGMMGVFVALDLFLFFVFWEVMLLPMYFLIGIWGGGPRRQYAAIKFFLYTLAGSVFMLLGFIWLYLNANPTYLIDGHATLRSFSIPELTRVGWLAKDQTILGMSAVKVVFAWLFVAFAIKIPMFPFHTWLPDAHVEAPTAVSIILAGILLKMGAYGLLRVNLPILPEASHWAAPAMAALGTVNILYGAFCAMAQTDLKKLVAYSSVSHMGFVLLAIGSMTPEGIQAGLFQMFSHGLITAMLFLLVGVVYDRVHTRDIDRFGGLAQEMPLYTAVAGLAFMASLGLPGLSGFWGEAMTFIGAFPRYRVLTVLAAAGLIITAAYHLWALQRVYLGPFKLSWRQSKHLEPFGGRFPQLSGREVLSFAPLALLVLLLGFWPRPLFDLSDRAVLELHRLLEGSSSTTITQIEAAPPSTVARR